MFLDGGAGPFPVFDPGLTEGPARGSLLLCRGGCAREKEQQWRWLLQHEPHTRIGGSRALLAGCCRGNPDLGEMGVLCSNSRGSSMLQLAYWFLKEEFYLETFSFKQLPFACSFI